MPKSVADTIAETMRALDAANAVSAQDEVLRAVRASEAALDAYRALRPEALRNIADVGASRSLTQSIQDAYRALEPTGAQAAMDALEEVRRLNDPGRHAGDLPGLPQDGAVAALEADLARARALAQGPTAYERLDHASPAVLSSALAGPVSASSHAFGDADPVAAASSSSAAEVSPRPPPTSISEVAALGARVRARRRELGLTQQAFADLAGVGRRFVVELEAGKPTLEIGRVMKVCQAAGLKLFVS